MGLEYAFFAAQSVGGTAEGHQPLVADGGTTDQEEGVADSARLAGVHERVALLCVDFDDTLTDGDTTSLLVKAATEQVDGT